MNCNFPATRKKHFFSAAAAVLAGSLLFSGGPVFAWGVEGVPVNDFLTGGGFIVRDTGAHANFGVAGGVKNGAWWGHLNYIDHDLGLHVQDIEITAYVGAGQDTVDGNGQPLGTRDICGTATTNLYGDVDFRVRVTDNGEPGENDEFIIWLANNGNVVYTTEGDIDHTLGDAQSGGGNIQLHGGNDSNTAPATVWYCAI